MHTSERCSGPANFMVDSTKSNPLIICMLSCFSPEFVRKTPESTMPTQNPPRIPLPQGWPSHVQSGLLPILSRAHCAIPRARGGAAQSVRARVRIAAEKDRLQQEIASVRASACLKCAEDAQLGPTYLSGRLVDTLASRGAHSLLGRLAEAQIPTT